jgi:hypothetical protein
MVMEEKSNVLSDGARLKRINRIFANKEVHEQLKQWEEEREVMQLSVLEIWDTGVEFTSWWKALKDEVRLAFVLTALEDLPQNIFSPLVGIVCPELEELNSTEQLIGVIKMVVDKKENNEETFNLQTFMKEFDEDDAPSEQVQSTLKLVRSCLLLQFATAIMLLYSNTKEDASLRSK